jgi:hypothetical protein
LAIELSNRGIHLVLLVTPENPYFSRTNAYGRYGPDRKTGEAIVLLFQAMARSMLNCHVFDANNGGHHDYTDEEARDIDHLCFVGAKKLSRRLDSLLITLPALK